MRDLFGGELAAWQQVEQHIRTISARFGYEEFRTPIVEHVELFKRGVGEHTDIVGKEMYVFEDRGGDMLTLRPEMTAPIVRAAIEHNLVRHKPTTRLWYLGPLFRYERPQKGRYRQFHQYGAELLGSPHPEADAEIILLAAELLRSLNVQNITLEINSLGTPASRVAYREQLVTFLTNHRDQLSADSQRRLDTNPLRVLDSKDEADRAVLAKAPLLTDHLDAESRTHFQAVLAMLDAAGVAYQINPVLVRGLDYYSHTVFEFTSTALGAQNTVCGGGRYDPLFAMLGGADVPAVGFSFGLERLMLILEEQAGGFAPAPPADVFVAALTDAARLPSQLVALRLRRAGFTTYADVLRRGAKAQFKEADRVHARWAVIIGDDELAADTLTIKDLGTGEQRSVTHGELLAALTRNDET
jgi:histidyl-tRNA synthetase